MKAAKLIVYCDGASRGNPGLASAGICIQDDQGATVKEIGEVLGIATNNFAEYRALERALQECVLLNAKQVQVYTDSQLLTRQFNGQYKVKHPDCIESLGRIKLLCLKIGSVKVDHILRSSHKGNVRADALANIALDKQKQQNAKPAGPQPKTFVQDRFL